MTQASLVRRNPRLLFQKWWDIIPFSLIFVLREFETITTIIVAIKGTDVKTNGPKGENLREVDNILNLYITLHLQLAHLLR